jgi:hypothetical protein
VYTGEIDLVCQLVESLHKSCLTRSVDHGAKLKSILCFVETIVGVGIMLR